MPVLMRVVARATARDAREAADDAVGGVGLVVATTADEGAAAAGNVLWGAALADAVRRTGLVDWNSGAPEPDRDAYLWAARRDADLRRADALGLRWLSVLARDAVPVGLPAGTGPAHAWFERLTFRVMTRALMLRGRRLGADVPGQPEPDGLLLMPDGGSVAVYDCKASGDDWLADRAAERQITEYAGRSWRWEDKDLPVTAGVVVSGGFQGTPGPRHPLWERRKRVKAASGADLAYVTARDLTATALDLCLRPAGEEIARLIDWAAVFAEGLVSPSGLAAAVNAATARHDALWANPADAATGA